MNKLKIMKMKYNIIKKRIKKSQSVLYILFNFSCDNI